MSKTRVFISFDYDHDLSQKNLLVGQSKNDDSPFEIADYSIKEVETNWAKKANDKMSSYVDVVIVLCGEYTDTARGVSKEIEMARDNDIPYYLLKAYTNKTIRKPTAAYSSDKVYDWTWDILKKLLK